MWLERVSSRRDDTRAARQSLEQKTSVETSDAGGASPLDRRLRVKPWVDRDPSTFINQSRRGNRFHGIEGVKARGKPHTCLPAPLEVVTSPPLAGTSPSLHPLLFPPCKVSGSGCKVFSHRSPAICNKK